MVNYRFEQFIESNRLIKHENSVLLAVSGGVDSIVMTHLFHQSGYRFAIVHCNFGLRCAESDGDERFVTTLADSMEVKCFSTRFNTDEYARERGLSIQMAARELRYTWFERVRDEQGFDFIATAHHLDDQAETMLINLARGTGIAGLHGIPLRNGRVIRPMMFATRKEIETFAAGQGILFREDRSNKEKKYTRNKIRHFVLPVLSEINPEFPANTAETVRKLSDYEKIADIKLREWAHEAVILRNGDVVISIEKIRNNSFPATFLWFLISKFGFTPPGVNEIMESLGETEEKIFYSSTHQLSKERTSLVIREFNENKPEQEFFIDEFEERKTITEPVNMEFTRLMVAGDFEIPGESRIATLDYAKLQFPLVLRKWRPGDEFRPFGMKGRKKLSDLFTDMKFSAKQKEATWILCSGGDIAWVAGCRIDDRFRVTKATVEVLRITLDPVPEDADARSNL